MLFFFLALLLSLVFFLLSIAFYTLFERKILSVAQNRLGPNKLFLLGIFQPLLDGLKLLVKSKSKIFNTPLVYFYIPSFILFLFSIFVWMLCLGSSFMSSPVFIFVFFLIILGLSIYQVMMVGFISISKFGFIGAIRSGAQGVSYEVSLGFQLLSLCFLINSFENFGSMNLGLVVFPVWWLSCVCETGRAPFDFAEGESELISGFNIEYSATGFVFVFLGEYGMMLALSMISSMLFFKGSLVIFTFLFLSLIIFRASYPRYRFDLLMKMCWKIILPVSVCFFLVFLLT